MSAKRKTGQYTLAQNEFVPTEHVYHIPKEFGDLGRFRDEQGYRLINKEDIVLNLESWATFSLAADPRWVVAVRIGPDETGALVPTELRVFPVTQPESRNQVGEWSRAAVDVPAGGLRARALRSINLRDHVRLARRQLVELAKTSDSRPKIQRFLDRLPVAVDPRVWKTAIAETRQRGSAERNKRIPRRTDAYFARLAVMYEEVFAVDPGRVNQALAERLGLSPSQVRDDVHEARAKRFLSPTSRGVPGGKATPKARALITIGEHRDREARSGPD